VKFKKRSGAVQAKVDEVEATVLAHLAGELLVLLAQGEQPRESDPLAAMVGMTTGPVPRPTDPGLARLLPDAYRADDEEGAAAAAEFRRYTEADLRAGKRADASTVVATLAPLQDEGGLLRLDRDQADAWLRCLNDLRLALGTRLEVTEDTELGPDPDDPDAQALHVYGWLGWLQESLIGCLDPLTPGS
jgi:hypothetical protein